jgi:hypothetical protein
MKLISSNDCCLDLRKHLGMTCPQIESLPWLSFKSVLPGSLPISTRP